jgi:hypothetical protein
MQVHRFKPELPISYSYDFHPASSRAYIRKNVGSTMTLYEVVGHEETFVSVNGSEAGAEQIVAALNAARPAPEEEVIIRMTLKEAEAMVTHGSSLGDAYRAELSQELAKLK